MAQNCEILKCRLIMSESAEKRYSAPALEKGLDILEYLAGHTVPCSRAEIAEALSTKYSPTQIANKIKDLQNQ